MKTRILVSMCRYLFTLSLVLLLMNCKYDKKHFPYPTPTNVDGNLGPYKSYLARIRDIEYAVVTETEYADFYIYNGDMLVHKKEILFLEELTKDTNIESIIHIIKRYNNSMNVAHNLPSYYDEVETCNAPEMSCIQKGITLWKNGDVVFSISSKFDKKTVDRIWKAINEWSSKTHIRISVVPHISDERKINIVPSKSGCSSSLGAPKGHDGLMQLSPTCDFYSIVHEIGHAVGLIHEHQRPKRDNYIDINYKSINVIRDKFSSKVYALLVDNFLVKTEVYNDSPPFDMKSVMLYGSYPRNNIKLRDYLIKNKLPMYTDKKGKEVPRPNDGLTETDVLKVNLAYPDCNK